MNDSSDQQRISQGLKRIRRLRISLYTVVLSFALVVYLLTLFDYPEWFVISVGASWVGVGIILEFVIGFARCPSCRKHFHVRGMSGNFFAKKCMNCGIPLKQER